MVRVENAGQFERDYESNMYAERDVLHAVYPREDYEPWRIDAKGKKWASVWVYCKGGKILETNGRETSLADAKQHHRGGGRLRFNAVHHLAVESQLRRSVRTGTGTRRICLHRQNKSDGAYQSGNSPARGRASPGGVFRFARRDSAWAERDYVRRVQPRRPQNPHAPTPDHGGAESPLWCRVRGPGRPGHQLSTFIPTCS